MQCHWLPVVNRIKFKLAVVTYHTLSSQQLIYLVNLLHFSEINSTLRSSIYKQLFVPETNLNTGKHAFFEAVSTIWNQLHITSSETIATFVKKKLKKNLFELAFSPQMFGGSMHH